MSPQEVEIGNPKVFRIMPTGGLTKHEQSKEGLIVHGCLVANDLDGLIAHLLAHGTELWKVVDKGGCSHALHGAAHSKRGTPKAGDRSAERVHLAVVARKQGCNFLEVILY